MGKKRLGVAILFFCILLYALPLTALAADGGQDVTHLLTVTGATVTDRAGNDLAGEADLSLGTPATLHYQLGFAAEGAIKGGDYAELLLPAALLADSAPAQLAVTLLDGEGNDTDTVLAYATVQAQEETLRVVFTDEILRHTGGELAVALNCSFSKSLLSGGSQTLLLGTARQASKLTLHFAESSLRVDNTPGDFALVEGEGQITWSLTVNPSELALHSPTVIDVPGEGQSLAGYRFAGYAENELPDGWQAKQEDASLLLTFDGLLEGAVIIEVTTRVESMEALAVEAQNGEAHWSAYNTALLLVEDEASSAMQPVASEAVAYLPLRDMLESAAVFNPVDNTVTWTVEINKAGHYLPGAVLELALDEGLGAPLLVSLTKTGRYTSTLQEAFEPAEEGEALSYPLEDLYGPAILTFTTPIDLPGYFENPESLETTLRGAMRLLWQQGTPEEETPAQTSQSTPEVTAEATIYNRLASLEAEWYSSADFTSWWSITLNEAKRELEGEVSVTASLLDGEYYHRLVHGSIQVTQENGQPLRESDWTLENDTAGHTFTITFAEGVLQGQTVAIRYETSVPRLLKTSKPGLFFTNSGFTYTPTVTVLAGGQQYTTTASQAITRRAIDTRAMGYDAETQSLGWQVVVNPFALPRLGGLVVTDILPEGTALAGLALYKAEAQNTGHGVYYDDLAYSYDAEAPLVEGVDYTLAYNEEARALVIEIADNYNGAYLLQLDARIEDGFLAEDYDFAAFTNTATLLAERAMDIVTCTATQWAENEATGR